MKTLNVCVVVLLSIIAVGIFTVPKFNYDVLVARQSKNESLLYTLQDRMDKVSLLSGPKQGERTAALEVLDQFPGVVSQLRGQLGAISEEQAAAHAELSGHRTRIEKLEGSPATGKATESPGSNGALPEPVRGGSYLEPVRLPEELTRKAGRFSSRGTAEMKLEDFVAASIESSLVRLKEPGEISSQGLEHINQVFELYKLNISLVQAEQQLHIQDLVQKRTLSGDYIDLPLDPGVLSEEVPPDQVGIRFVKLFNESGVKRVFDFPLDSYPEINTFNEMRDNARDHLVRDVAGIPESVLKGN
jgi:hypothetical protein